MASSDVPAGLDLDNLKYDAGGLLPAVIQDIRTGSVLMVGYMNQEALRRTIEGGRVWFWSRSRSEYWLKGESSGNYFSVKAVYADCDADTLLIRVIPEGPGVACHTGRYSCFFTPLTVDEGAGSWTDMGTVSLERLIKVIRDRRLRKPSGSYTARIFEEGPEAIARKFGEESLETVIAYLRGSRQQLAGEAADLLYHLLVLLEDADLPVEAVFAELAARGRRKND